MHTSRAPNRIWGLGRRATGVRPVWRPRCAARAVYLATLASCSLISTAYGLIPQVSTNCVDSTLLLVRDLQNQHGALRERVAADGAVLQTLVQTRIASIESDVEALQKHDVEEQLRVVQLSEKALGCAADVDALQQRYEALAANYEALLERVVANEERVAGQALAVEESAVRVEAAHLEQRARIDSMADRIAALSVARPGSVCPVALDGDAVLGEHARSATPSSATTHPSTRIVRRLPSTRPVGRRLSATVPQVNDEEPPLSFSAAQGTTNASAALHFRASGVSLVAHSDAPGELALQVNDVDVATVSATGVQSSPVHFRVNGTASFYYPVSVGQSLSSAAVGDPARCSVACFSTTGTDDVREVLTLAYRGGNRGFAEAEAPWLPSPVSELRCFGGWQAATSGAVAWLRGGEDVRYVFRTIGGGAMPPAVGESGMAVLGDSGAPAVEVITDVRLEAISAVSLEEVPHSSAILRSLLAGAVAVPVSPPSTSIWFKEDVTELSAAAGLAVGTVQAEDNMGTWGNAVSALDDVDGDGVRDIVVGLRHDDDAGTDAGSVLVLRMLPEASVLGQQKITDGVGLEPGVSLQLDTGDRFGASVVGMADWDADGVPEVAVGASGDDDGGESSGAVWLLFLTSSSTVRAAVKIGAASGDGAIPWDASDHAGQGLSTLPRMSSNGKDALLVGAHGDDDGGDRYGAVYVVFLRDDDDDSSLAAYDSHTKISHTSGVGFTFTQPGTVQYFGHSVAYISHNAGTATIAGGAPYADDGGTNFGNVYVIQLESVQGPQRVRVVASQQLSATRGGLAQLGPGPSNDDDHWGVSVYGLPDLDGDGVRDLLVGARVYQGDGRGFADVLFMSPSLTPHAGVRLGADAASPLPAAAKQRIMPGARWAASVACLGDIDGDGAVELAFAAPYDDAGGATDSGAVFIVRLKPVPDDARWELRLRLPSLPPRFASDDEAKESGLQPGELYRLGGDGEAAQPIKVVEP